MKIAVILSGCGVRDGSEIHESVTALLCMDQAGHEVQMFAPDKEQTAVINGVTGKATDEKRNILVESARIARGNIQALTRLCVADFDAVVLPGGFGAATNLCDFAINGPNCAINPDLERVLMDARNAGKIMGFMCIAPVIAARVFGKDQVRMTIGNDPGTAAACEAMGANHICCRYNEACVDARLKVVTTPAYMLAASIAQCYESAKAMLEAIENLHG
jgi:enhancing lycopene biosynthesis protein 2